MHFLMQADYPCELAITGFLAECSQYMGLLLLFFLKFSKIFVYNIQCCQVAQCKEFIVKLDSIELLFIRYVI